MGIARTVILILFAFSLFCCVPEKIILPGVINGNVTDADIEQPLDNAIVTLKKSQTTLDIDTTDISGQFQFKHLPKGNYQLTASKQMFKSEEKTLFVEEANSHEISFDLIGEPYPEFSSTWIDFGFESTEGSLIISNAGRGELEYFLSTNQDWITVEPITGKLTTGADTIRVTINRAGLLDKKYEEEIYFLYSTSEGPIRNTIDVLLNGIVDRDGNFYSIVTIGTQTWLQENLNTGVQITEQTIPSDNSIIEKYCYDNDAANCETYGGLYTWSEMMDYSPSDTGMIGTTQGVCPSGWHIPTTKEMEVLVEYLGGWDVAGGRMKAYSPLWEEGPGEMDSGFEALPGGNLIGGYVALGRQAYFMTTDSWWIIHSQDTDLIKFPIDGGVEVRGFSVRCIKGP